MGRPQPTETKAPDEQTLRAWEEMRVEILHELQEGGSADVPDALIDDLGDLIVMLGSSKAEPKSLSRLPLGA